MGPKSPSIISLIIKIVRFLKNKKGQYKVQNNTFPPCNEIILATGMLYVTYNVNTKSSPKYKIIRKSSPVITLFQISLTLCFEKMKWTSEIIHQSQPASTQGWEEKKWGSWSLFVSLRSTASSDAGGHNFIALRRSEQNDHRRVTFAPSDQKITLSRAEKTNKQQTKASRA